MKSNTSHEFHSKTLTKIIIVMQNIEFTPSPDSTIITSENIEATIEKRDHEVPTIRSQVSNSSFISIIRKHAFKLSKHI